MLRLINFFYEQNFGLITPFIADGIHAWIDDLNAELVIKAMEIALEKNTRNMSYVNTILRDWHLKGFKTVTDVETADKAFRAQRLTKAQQQTQAPYQQRDYRSLLKRNTAATSMGAEHSNRRRTCST